MALYLTAFTSSGTSVPPQYKQRNIIGYTHAPLNGLNIQGVPHQRELAYDGYISNIDVFIAATNRQMTLLTSTPGSELSNKTRPLIPLSPPRVTFQLRVDLTAEQQTAFLAKIAVARPQVVQAGKKTRFILHNPTTAIIEKIAPNAELYSEAQNHEILPKSWEAYEHLLRCITEFLATNTYPAFSDKTPEEDEHDLIQILEFYNTATKEVQIPREKGKDRAASEGPSRKKAKLESIVGNMDVDEDPEESEEESEDEMETVLEGSTTRAQVLKAKPSPVPASFNFGRQNSIPHMPGLLLPYFDRMNLPDKTTIRSIFSKHFLRTMSDSRETWQTKYKDYRLQFDTISSTPQGQAIAHMLFCIDLALQTQTRLFCVITDSGEYIGSCLLGERFSIFDGAKWLSPRSADELFEDCKTLTAHSKGIHFIAQILSGCKGRGLADDSPLETCTPDDLKNAGEVMDEIYGRELTKDQEKELEKYLPMLSFSRAYLPISASNIVWAIDQMTTHINDPLPDTTPIYVPNGPYDLFDKKRFRVLCAFGPDSFSLFNNSGTTFAIPAIGKEDPADVIIEATGKKTLPSILVGIKAVAAAYNDFEKVVKDKAIRMDFAERAARHRCSAMYDGKRDAIWKALKTHVGSLAGEKKESKKRKREIAAAEPVASTSAVTADDLLALF